MVQHVNPEPYEFMKILHKIWTGTGVQFLHGFTRVCVHTALLFLYGLALGCLTTLLPAYLWSLLPYNQYEYFSAGRPWSWLLWIIKYVQSIASIVFYPLLVLFYYYQKKVYFLLLTVTGPILVLTSIAVALPPFLDYIMPWGRPKWTWYAIVLLVFAVFDTSWVAYATGAQQKFKEPLLKYLAFPFIFGSTALILLFFLYSEYVGLPTMVVMRVCIFPLLSETSYFIGRFMLIRIPDKDPHLQQFPFWCMLFVCTIVGRLCTFELTTYPSLIVSEILLSLETIVMRTSFKIRDVLRLWKIDYMEALTGWRILSYMTVLLGRHKKIDSSELPHVIKDKDGLFVRQLSDPQKYWELTRDFRATILNAETIVQYSGILGVSSMILSYRHMKSLFFFARVECSTEYVVISTLIQLGFQAVVDFICTFAEELYFDIPSAPLRKIIYPCGIVFHVYLNIMWTTWMIGELVTWCW